MIGSLPRYAWLRMLVVAMAATPGCSRTASPPVVPVKIEIRLAQNEPAEGFEEFVDPGTKKIIYVHKEAVVTNADVAKSLIAVDQKGRPANQFVFANASRKKIAEFSSRNIGKAAAVFLDGKLRFAPIMRATISDTAEVSGNLTVEEAELIVKGITAE